jgi:hypothetical protein
MAKKKPGKSATKKASKATRATKAKGAHKTKKAKKTTAARKRAPLVARAKPTKRSVAAKKPPAPAKRKKPVPAPKAKPFGRRTGAGHIDPKYGAELLARSGPPADDGQSFLTGPRSGDDLAEELGEGFVESATTGEYEGEETHEQVVDEESGGPFVETSGATEFAAGTDASNPIDAKREPFPKT